MKTLRTLSNAALSQLWHRRRMVRHYCGEELGCVHDKQLDKIDAEKNRRELIKVMRKLP